MGQEQQTASIDKIKGTDWRKKAGFIDKNDAFNEVYEEGSGMDRYWDVENKKGELLGRIIYWKPWKKWVWEQEEDIIMSEICLQDVASFLKEIKEEKPKRFN